jgi:glycosyltransferase involved in cell wall biosynthesis
MKRIDVLHLVASSRGGGAVHVRDLALGLDPDRFRVQVAMPEDGGTVRREEFEAAGIPFHPVEIAEGLSLREVRRLRRLSIGKAILHVHGARAALFGRLAASRMDRRPAIVYTIHGFATPYYPQPRRGLLLAIERLLAPRTDRFVAVCEAERAALLAAGIGSPERIETVRNGIDVARFRDPGLDRTAARAHLGVPADAFLVTTICRLFKPRDFDTLLRAFQRVAAFSAAAHLLVVGDGPLRPQIEHTIASLSLDDRVTLTGWHRHPPAIYAASDVYVLTTWGWEGLPLTVLEAMAAGLPVIATAAGGVPEAVVDGETGFLVPRRDVDSLAHALRSAAQNPGRARTMGAAGRARAERLFTTTRMVAETARIYEHLLAAAPQSPPGSIAESSPFW